MSIIRRIASTSIGLFWSSFVGLQCIGRFIMSPRKFLYVKPRPTPPPCLTDETLGTHGYVQLKDVKLHYVSKGDESKPLMLCLHGFPEFWYSWRHQLREFSKEYRVVAVDQRGYGYSDKPGTIYDYRITNLVEDVKQLITALGHDSCVLVSHDWGGAVAWAFASAHPDMVNRLIVCNVPHPSAMLKFMSSSWKQFLMSWYMFYFCVPLMPEWVSLRGDVDFLDGCFYSKNMGLKNRSRFTKDDLEAFKFTFGDRDKLYGPISWYRATMFYPEKLKSKNIPESVPSLLIWGTKDGALSTEMAAMSGKYCKNFTLKYVEGASHWVQQDEPDVVNKYMWDFLKESPTNSISKL